MDLANAEWVNVGIDAEDIRWQPDAAALREEIRRMVIEELSQLVRR